VLIENKRLLVGENPLHVIGILGMLFAIPTQIFVQTDDVQ
jgi:hypothetical protein